MATVQPLHAIVVGAPRLVSKLDPTVVAASAVAGIRAAAASAASRTGVAFMARILSDARRPFVLRANGLASSARRIDDRVTIGSRAPAKLPPCTHPSPHSEAIPTTWWRATTRR